MLLIDEEEEKKRREENIKRLFDTDDNEENTNELSVIERNNTYNQRMQNVKNLFEIDEEIEEPKNQNEQEETKITPGMLVTNTSPSSDVIKPANEIEDENEKANVLTELDDNHVIYNGSLIDTEHNVAITRNRNNSASLNQVYNHDILEDPYAQYKMNKHSTELAKEINEETSKGGLSAIGAFIKNTSMNFAGGMSQSVFGLANLVNGIAAIGSRGSAVVSRLMGNNDVADKLDEKYAELVSDGKMLNEAGNYISSTNSRIENDFIRTSGNVASVIGRQIMDYGIGGAANVSGAKIQALGVAGASFQEVLNENPGNLFQASLTSTLKGTVAYWIEKMFDANLLTRGAGSSSIEKEITKIISKNINSKLGKEALNFVIGVTGENVEELMEDNIDYLIDNLINDKEFPTFEEWWNNTSDTIKTTTISTIIMNLFGFGGESFENKEYELSQDQEFWIHEAQKVIDKNNLAVMWDTNSILNLSGAGVFYNTTFDSDGNIQSISPVAGKLINSSNSNVNIEPVIIYNKKGKYYNIIDSSTGIILDSTPYKNMEIAEQEFNTKMNNLDQAAIENVNNKIAQANRTINQEINQVATNIESERNAERITQQQNVINTAQITNENVMNDTQNGLNNVKVNQNANINTNLNANTYTNNSNMNTDTYQTSQNQFADDYSNETANYASNSINTPTSQNNGLQEVQKLVSQISDNSIYNSERASQVFRTVARNIPNIELQVTENGASLNSLNENGEVVYSQKLSGKSYRGAKIKQIINNAISNADISNTNTAQANQNEFRDTFDNETASYMPQNENAENNVSNLSDEEIKNKKEETVNQIPSNGSATIKINTAPSIDTSIAPNSKVVNTATNNQSMQNNENNTNNNVRAEKSKVDISSKIKYNGKGIKLSKKEYANVMSLINTNKPDKMGMNYISSSNYFYIYKNDEFGNNTVLARIEIEGNENLLKKIREEFRDGGIDREREVINKLIQKYPDARGGSNSNNVMHSGQREESKQNDRLYTERKEINEKIRGRQDSNKSTRNKSGIDNGIRVEKINNTVEYDNQGNKLTKAQREFFKDSKVRDENDKLKVVYHGTNNEFTIFDRNKSGQSNSNAKIGFWFTETKEGARKFAESVWYGNKKNSEVFEVYLDIKNPKIYKSIDNSKELNTLEEKMTNLKQKIRQIENRNINIEINSSAIRYASDEAELIDIAEQNGIIKRQDEFVSTAQEYKKLLNDYDNTEREYNNKRYNDAYELFRTDIYKVAGKDANDANFGGTGMWLENESEILQKYKSNLEKQGYDGIIIQGTNYDSETMGRNNTQYVVFNSNQIKNVTNASPTSNPDIRYENTDNSNNTSQPYDARKYEKNKDFINYLKDNNYLKTLMEVDNTQGSTYAHSANRLIEQEIRKLEQTNGFDNSIPVTKLMDIDREIEKYLKRTIGKGHFRERGARGIYNQQTDRISIKEYKDLDNVFHELGHALDLGNRINVNKSELSDELLAATKRHGGYDNESIGVQLDEGFAEILKTYAINKDIVKQDYPKSYNQIENIKARNIEFGEFITNIQKQTYNYIHQNPRNRILGNQSIGEQTDRDRITIDTITRNAMKLVWDSNYSTKQMVNEFTKATGHKPNASQNAYLLTRLAGGVDNKIVSMLTNGYIDENGKRLMPGLNKIGEILGNNPERMNDLRAYLAAKRDLEYKAKSLKTGLRTSDSKAIIEQFYNDTQIQEAAQVVYDTLDGVLQYAVDNGVITEEAAKTLRGNNVFYVPFQRVIEGRGNNIGRRGAVSDIIKQRTGSELDIKDILENIVTNSANIIKQVENNNILRAVYEQGEETGMKNNIFDVIPAPMKKIGTEQLATWEAELVEQGVDVSQLDLDKTIELFAPNNNIITEKDGSHIVSFFDKGGKRRYLQFYKNSTDIFNSLMGLDRNANSVFLKLMRSANMPLRYGATMANVGFAIPNMISDTVQAAIYSEAGFIPVIDNAIGVLDVLGATNKTVRNFLNQVAPEYAERINRLYDIYQQTGASSSTRMSQYRKSSQEIMKEIYGTKNSETLGIKESFKPLKRLMDILTYIPELSESSTRFRVFERNYDAYKNKGSSEIDARIQAAIESRDATQDFGRTGTFMHEVNQLIPFSAARVGSAYTFAEKVRANPKRVATRTALLLTVAMAIKALGYDDDEIEELNQRKKDDNFILKIGNTVITIKKPQGILRSMINLTEYIQDLFTGHIEEGKEGERLVNWVTNAIMDNMPADSVTGLVPNAIAPVVENAINKDFYYNTDIVKSYDLDLPESQQYYDYTSQLAIWLGQIFNYSPAKIDNLTSGYLGGLGTQITDIIDWVSAKLGLSAEEPDMGAEDNAVGKRFVVNVNENSASVDEIYNSQDELTKKLNGGTITKEEEEELENIKAGISKLSALNKQIKAIKQDLTMSGTEKAEAIRPLQEQKTDVARQALGKDTIYTENTDELEALSFYPTRSTLSYNGLTLNMTEDMKKEYMDLAYELYSKYTSQKMYSDEYLEILKSKVKDTAKKKMISKYKNKLVRDN